VATACILAVVSGALGAQEIRADAAPGGSEIEQLVAEGKLDEAISAAREAVQAHGSDADPHMVLAQALATKGREVIPVVEAEIDTAAGLRILPFPRPGKNTKIDVIYDPELLEEALAEVRKAIRIAPQRIDLRYSECYLLTDAGLIEKAAAAILRAIERFPDRPEMAPTLASYGNERMIRGDAAGGASLLGVVAAAFPEDAEVLTAYGTALAHTGRREEALLKLDRAAKLGERDASIQRRVGIVNLLCHDFARARTAYLRAHLLSHDTADRFGAAVAQYGLEPGSSRSDFEALAEPSREFDPSSNAVARDFLRAIVRPDTRMDLARSLVNEQHGLMAIPVLTHLLAQQPDNDDARALMAEIYRDTGFPLR
jgi:Flp pilus assembly protein TadD